MRTGSGQGLQKFFSRKNPRPWACQRVTSQATRQPCRCQRERLSLLSSVPGEYEQCPGHTRAQAGGRRARGCCVSGLGGGNSVPNVMCGEIPHQLQRNSLSTVPSSVRPPTLRLVRGAEPLTLLLVLGQSHCARHMQGTCKFHLGFRPYPCRSPRHTGPGRPRVCKDTRL